ncbi:MAG: DUF1800 domain-containing protein [Bacteroidia bacterium]|nr:DUF1800 domain-containing protein [Bacteroidia bacterium]
MNRRDFLSLSSVSAAPQVVEAPKRIMAGDLSPFEGTWDRATAAHLLRRTCFGPTPEEIDQALNLGLDGTLNLLFGNKGLPAPPVMYDFDDDKYAAEGQTWIEAPVADGGNNGRRIRSLRAWSIGLMVNEGIHLRESLTLFWHNHFSVEQGKVGEARNAYQYLDTLRRNALGNFKTLVEKVTILPAMLVYLDGRQNVKGRPNENYARELFELFSIGKGPLIGPGNYTYFTETDVLAAAECLTGWSGSTDSDEPGVPQVEFREDRHETGDKVFSSAFDGQVIKNQGQDEYKALIEMIFNRRQTAIHIVKKLYRWFLYYEIDENIHTNIIEPLADQLMEDGYEIKGVLRRFFASDHFLNAENHGGLIKHPIDFVVGTAKLTQFPIPTGNDFVNAYHIWYELMLDARDMQMEFLSPPDVAGWPAYYQEPLFHKIWINSVTLPNRIGFIKSWIDRGFRRGETRIEVDTLDLLSTVSDPFDPNVLISDWIQRFLPQPLSEGERNSLKNVLIPGLPDFEWTEEYMIYLQNPNDEMAEKSVRTKLEALLTSILTLAEFQLS